MQFVVNTEGGFYRHYIRVRRWYGKNDEPAKRGGLCKPCQTILWGTPFAVVVSPLIGIAWLLAKAFDRVAAGGGNSVVRRVGKLRLDSGETLAERSTRGIAESPVVEGAIMGILVLAAVSTIVVLIGTVGLGAWHISDIAAWIGDACTWIGNASLTVGWFAFAALAYVGLALDALVGAIHQAGIWAIENKSWLIGWAIVILPPAAIAVTLSWVFTWFCLNTKLGAMLLADPAKGLWMSYKLAAKMRRDCREEAAKWSCACGQRNSRRHTWCSKCVKVRVYGPPGLGGRLSRWFCGRVVAGKMNVMGGGGIAWAFVKSLAKGACPLVEFLSPDEQHERALTIAKDDRAKRADAIEHILGRRG